MLVNWLPLHTPRFPNPVSLPDDCRRDEIVAPSLCRLRDQAAAAPTPVRPSVVGKIAVVDEEKRFVLIDLDSNLYVPAPGRGLAFFRTKPNNENRSFRFYYREGETFYRDSKQALRYAMGRLGYLEKEGRLFDPQLLLELEEAVERTKRNCSP